MPPVHLRILSHPEDSRYAAALGRHLTPCVASGAVVLCEPHHSWETLLVILVSPDLVADAGFRVVTKQAMQRRAHGGLRVVPVLVRPAQWEGEAYGGLVPLPEAEPPTISACTDHDEAWRAVVTALLASPCPEAMVSHPEPTGPTPSSLSALVSDLSLEQSSALQQRLSELFSLATVVPHLARLLEISLEGGERSANVLWGEVLRIAHNDDIDLGPLITLALQEAPGDARLLAAVGGTTDRR